MEAILIFNTETTTGGEDQQIFSARLLLNPWCCLALGCGVGLVRVAQGTAGTLIAMLLFYLIALSLGLLGQPFPWYLHTLLLVVSGVLGVYACDVTAKITNTDDHNAIVLDEFVGYWLSLWAVPITWYWLLTAFVLFRFFDIVKPFPVNWADKQLSGGLGIMADDLLAAIYTVAVMQLLLLLWR